MSLIMDALEKVQRETKPLVAVTEWPKVDQPRPAVMAKPVQEFARIPDEETAPIRRGPVFFVFLFAVFLFAGAVLGFQKISTGLSLPQPGLLQKDIASRSHADHDSVAQPPAQQSVGPGILRGVLQDPAGSFCILGDQILKTGDTWRGYTVLSIEAQQVVVQDTQNRLLTLYLQES